jgi:hypothetical protein
MVLEKTMAIVRKYDEEGKTPIRDVRSALQAYTAFGSVANIISGHTIEVLTFYTDAFLKEQKKKWKDERSIHTIFAKNDDPVCIAIKKEWNKIMMGDPEQPSHVSLNSVIHMLELGKLLRTFPRIRFYSSPKKLIGFGVMFFSTVMEDPDFADRFMAPVQLPDGFDVGVTLINVKGQIYPALMRINQGNHLMVLDPSVECPNLLSTVPLGAPSTACNDRTTTFNANAETNVGTGDAGQPTRAAGTSLRQSRAGSKVAEAAAAIEENIPTPVFVGVFDGVERMQGSP